MKRILLAVISVCVVAACSPPGDTQSKAVPPAPENVGFLTDYDPTEEYRLMAGAGFDWFQILAALTTAPAERFDEGARRGRIAPGMDADIVVLTADPSIDVTAFAEVGYTIRRGRIVYKKPD